MIKGREPKPLTDCNGLACGVTDLDERNPQKMKLTTKQNFFYNTKIALVLIRAIDCYRAF